MVDTIRGISVQVGLVGRNAVKLLVAALAALAVISCPALAAKDKGGDGGAVKDGGGKPAAPVGGGDGGTAGSPKTEKGGAKTEKGGGKGEPPPASTGTAPKPAAGTQSPKKPAAPVPAPTTPPAAGAPTGTTSAPTGARSAPTGTTGATSKARRRSERTAVAPKKRERRERRSRRERVARAERDRSSTSGPPRPAALGPIALRPLSASPPPEAWGADGPRTKPAAKETGTPRGVERLGRALAGIPDGVGRRLDEFRAYAGPVGTAAGAALASLLLTLMVSAAVGYRGTGLVPGAAALQAARERRRAAEADLPERSPSRPYGSQSW